MALEGNSVRGAYILRHQQFSFKGKILSGAFIQWPMSEGIVDKKYNLIGLQLLVDAIKRQPLIFALGMGGYGEPLPKMLQALGWSMYTVPFFFKVIHPQQFLKNITYLRTIKFGKLLLEFLRITGSGWLGIKLSHALTESKKLRDNSLFFEVVDNFAHWSDELWERCKDKFSMIAVRNNEALNILYPEGRKRFIRLKILQNGEVVGWALVLDTQMANHKQFGNMRVGSIVDCLALPQNTFEIVAAATMFLEKAGVDIIVSNQSHISWCRALRRAGFVSGPSNFIFAASKELAKLLIPFDTNKITVHLNRGDGDGPVRL
ncbi:MAG: hypothetical protein GWN62_27220 [Aliifodinibius sp.]|nr:hypothetical protein [Fodinibius sp.]